MTEFIWGAIVGVAIAAAYIVGYYAGLEAATKLYQQKVTETIELMRGE